jgi:hypothetical protein
VLTYFTVVFNPDTLELTYGGSIAAQKAAALLQQIIISEEVKKIREKETLSNEKKD